MPPQILENIVILCFERRFSKQNSVIRLKSNISLPNILGWLRQWNNAPAVASTAAGHRHIGALNSGGKMMICKKHQTFKSDRMKN